MRNGSKKLKIVAAVIVVLAVIISFVTMSGGFNGVTGVLGAIITPVQSAVSSVSDHVQGFFEYFYKFDSLKAENEALKDELKELKELERKYNSAIDENNSLRILARLSIENPTYEYEFAAVTAINTGDYHKVITIDKGAADGIELYDCAIVREGVVGYVTKVGPNFSEITAITDPTTKIGAIVSETQEIAVAEGDAEYIKENKLRLSYLDNDTEAKKRHVVETSGYGDIYPKGLVIGYIEEIKPETHGLSSYAVINPAVEFTKLKKVYVIKEFTN